MSKRTFLIVRSHGDYLVRFHGALIRRLVAAGHRVVGACPAPTAGQSDALQSMGAAVVDFPFNRRGLDPIADMFAYQRFAASLRDIAPDVALLITIKPIIFGVHAARQAGCAKVFAMLSGLGYAFGQPNDIVDRVLGGIGRALLQQALRRCDGVLCHNDADLDELRRRGLIHRQQPTLVTLGSGVDLQLFPSRPLPENPSVLMIARLVGAKGVRDYVEAARIVRAIRPDIVFRLVGWLEQGPDAITQAEIDTWEDEGAIQFVGRLNDVGPALADCSLFALPTYYREGLPRTILEAMATGRPVVTTDIPGCRDTVEARKNGQVVPPRDARALADAILDLMSDHQRLASMAASSRARAESMFDSTANAASVARFMHA